MTETLDIPAPDKMAKVRAAKSKKKESTATSTSEMATTIAVEVAKALAGVQAAQKAADKKPDEMTQEELKAEHERLQKALEALPYVGDKIAGKPGTIIGEGMVREYIPHTREWFTDIEARRKDRNNHNGQPAELTWPNYGYHDVLYQGIKPWLDVKINGVTFTVLNNVPCQLPTPFYSRYMEFIRGGAINDQRFREPDNPSQKAGYMHVNPETGLAVLLGKGALPSMAEREASDRPA